MTLKTALIAVAAVMALIGAAVIAVPSLDDDANLCRELPGCPAF